MKLFILLSFLGLNSFADVHLPQGFHFCVSTAAHQIEGGNFNTDWWEWEQVPGHIKNGDTSRIATDSWNHVDEDIANMKMLGVDTYRFSIEWAKIEPKPRQFDEIMLNRYIQLIQKLKANGIEPLVTLYHFTLPLWVSHQGGWEWDGIKDAYGEYVTHVVRRIGNSVKIWITLNEPMTIVAAAYMSNIFPPGKNDLHSFAPVMANMVRTHALGYHIIHGLLDSETFKPQVGIAHILRVFDPKYRLSPLDHYLAKKMDEISNWAIPNALETGFLNLNVKFLVHANYEIPEAKHTQDFFGLNYYSRSLVAFSLFKNPVIELLTKKHSEESDLGWEIYPFGFGRMVEQVKLRFPGLKIWITENGVADAEDGLRRQFLRDHLSVLSDELSLLNDQVSVLSGEMESGAPVEGYCHWTLNDNFEWAEGYTAKFGLFSIEPGTLRRIPRSSAFEYQKIISSTRLPN